MPEINEANLKKLEKMFAVMDEATLSRKEFTDAFQKVVDLVLKIEAKQDQAIEALRIVLQQTLKKIEDQTGISLTNLEKKVDNLFIGDKFEEMKKELNALVIQKLAAVDVRMTKVRDGGIGPRGEQGPKGEPGRSPLAEEIGLALKPTIDAFRKSWEEKVQQAMARRGVGVGGGRQIRMTSFSFSGDGTTTSFALPTSPGAKGNAIWAYLNGQQIQKGTHFTIGRKTLDTTFTPANGDTIEGFLMNE